MNSNLTVVIPFASYHRDLVPRAVASVQAQTYPCEIVTVEDTAGKGAGWARNQGLRQVTTPFVAFLDADDTLEPRFAELALDILAQVQGKGQRYVYTNWYEGDKVKVAPSPCDVWTMQTYHVVTTVMRTSDVRRIGGYDETMPGAEDTDFGIRLKISGVCGIHLNEPLMHYNIGGRRSKDLRISGQEVVMLDYMKERYKEYTMGCCGDPTPPQSKPDGERYDGDVMAMALWAGNRQERGLATGRVYPRSGNGKIVYVDPRDVAAAPHMWQKVSAMPNTQAPALQPNYQAEVANWQAAGNAAFGGGQEVPVTPAAQMEWQYKPVENQRTTNDVLKIAKRKTE